MDNLDADLLIYLGQDQLFLTYPMSYLPAPITHTTWIPFQGNDYVRFTTLETPSQT